MSDSNEILRVLTKSADIKESDPNINYYRQLAKWAMENRVQTQKKNISLDSIGLSNEILELVKDCKLPNQYTTLGHLLNNLVELMKKKAQYNPSNPLTQKIQQITLEILEVLSKKKNPKPAVDEAPEKEASNSTEDNPKLYIGMGLLRKFRF